MRVHLDPPPQGSEENNSGCCYFFSQMKRCDALISMQKAVLIFCVLSLKIREECPSNTFLYSFEKFKKNQNKGSFLCSTQCYVFSCDLLKFTSWKHLVPRPPLPLGSVKMTKNDWDTAFESAKQIDQIDSISMSSSRKESPYYQGSVAVATGWGRTIEGGSSSDVSIFSTVTEMRYITKRIENNIPSETGYRKNPPIFNKIAGIS